MLTAIKKYLMAHKNADIKELSCKFKTDPVVVRTMLKHWIRKGKVNLIDNLSACNSGCTQCMPVEVYQWQH